MGRKDLVMRPQRRFSVEFKRSVIEELLSESSSTAQICRRYNISSGLLYHWKKQYARGKFGNEPTQEAVLADRVEKLERLVGQLTLENEFLKKALRCTLEKAETRGTSLANTSPGSKASKGGVNS
jgi:transposase